MRGQRNAIDRSRLAKKARPLGEFIVEQVHRKTRGVSDIPPPPRVGSAEKIRKKNRTKATGTPNTRERRVKKDSVGEATILHNCLRWLHRQGAFTWRNNTGTAWLDGRPVSFGYPGSADITGILRDGRRLEVECKTIIGKQSDKQKQFQQEIEANNGVYLLVHSVDELIKQWTERGLK